MDRRPPTKSIFHSTWSQKKRNTIKILSFRTIIGKKNAFSILKATPVFVFHPSFLLRKKPKPSTPKSEKEKKQLFSMRPMRRINPIPGGKKILPWRFRILRIRG